MTFWQVVLAIIFPPLAVISRGCGATPHHRGLGAWCYCRTHHPQ